MALTGGEYSRILFERDGNELLIIQWMSRAYVFDMFVFEIFTLNADWSRYIFNVPFTSLIPLNESSFSSHVYMYMYI